MTAGNGKGTLVTPQDVLSEHANRQRRMRKPTIGEVEDAMNDFASKMLQEFGPLAVALREMRLDLDARRLLLDTLRRHVGAAHVLTEGDLSAWELDWRRRWRGRALAVVRPLSSVEADQTTVGSTLPETVSMRCATKSSLRSLSSMMPTPRR